MSENPAREAELQRLIAEQADDDTPYVSQWERSLDAPLGDDDGDGSLYDLVGERRIDATPASSNGKQSHKVTAQQLKEWRGLRNKEHWTYAQIAEYASVQVKTVRQHLQRGRSVDPFSRTPKRFGTPKVKLMERIDQFQGAYEAGACLREIAEVHYEELGYKSWESCYQQLRLSLREAGVVLRPKRTTKHGLRSASATPEEYRRYWKQKNREATERRRAELVRCDAVVKSGRPCRRFAVLGTRFCVNHNEETKRQPKWTKANVIGALREWAEAHGRPPQSADWAKAEDGHPNFTTVANLFGRWTYALYEAGLRKRKHPKKERRSARLAKGYKPCGREGCRNTVPPSWRYCRDRRCQDARGASVVEPRHGTLSGYKIGGCRCDLCNKANTEYQRQYRLRQAA